jgi:outer membrane receptor protein involved in Fe transport
MTRSRKRKLQGLAAKWAGMPLAAAAFAQGGVAQAQQTAGGGGLEEIIVTAQKKVEDVQKVPISIQVLGGEKLEQLQVVNFIDYAKFMPSMSFQTVGPGQSQVYFRGVSSGYSNLHAGPAPSTGVYLDETPVTTISGVLDIHMYDIQRVEGLAGPQGTLYGASAEAGTLRIITNKPDPTKFEAGYDVKGTALAKGDPGGSFEGFVNLPAGDKAAIRLVGYYDKEGGYIDNVPHSITYQRPAGGTFNFTPSAQRPWLWTVAYNSLTGDYTNEYLNPHPGTFNNDPVVKKKFNYVENYGGRVAMKLDLNDNWTVNPTVMHQNQKANGDFGFDPKVGDLKTYDMRPTYNNDKWTQSALTITGKISNLDVVYSGSWFDRHVDNEYDYALYSVGYDYCWHVCYTYLPEVGHQNDGPNISGVGGPNLNKLDVNPVLIDPSQYVQNHDDYTKLSHELRFSTPANYSTRLIAGAFYQRQTDKIRAEFRIDGLSDYWSVPRNPGILYLSDQERVDRDAAVFADVTHDFTDKFKVSAGIREFSVNNTLFGFFGYNAHLPSSSSERICFEGSPAGSTRPCINTDSHVKESGETHRVNLTYQFEPNRMVYATYSTGYRPAGNNRRPQAKSWKSDTLTNVEIGWKTSWRGNTVRFNGAIFHEDWKSLIVPIQGENGITSMVNAGDARTEGFESDLTWLATDQLNLSVSGTYVKANTTSDFCQPTSLGVPVATCTPDLLDAPAGTRLPGVPQVKANATARYRFNVNGYESFAQLAGVYQGSTTFSLEAPKNALVGDTPAYESFDFSIGMAKNRWTLEAYVNNLTDKRGELARTSECAAASCNSNYRIVPIMPLNFGLKFGQRF